MVLLGSLFVLASLWIVDGFERFQPTEWEVSKALAFQTPPSSWGQQARQERDLRLFAIGGSNTRNNYYPDPIIRDFATRSRDWTASLHRIGVGGVLANDLIGYKFEFEGWEKSEWPNVIMVELSANIYLWNCSTAAQSVDTLIRVIQRKYSIAKVPQPDFMFLELFSVYSLIEDTNVFPTANQEHKIEMLKSETGSDLCNWLPLTDCPNYFAIRRVASFYGYPIVSWREMAVNAFFRFYLASNVRFSEPNCDACRWSYTVEGWHITSSGGVLLYDTLLGPFFRQIMTPRTESEWNQSDLVAQSSTDQEARRMFPPRNVSVDLISERILPGVGRFSGNLSGMFRQPTLWQPMTFHLEPAMCSYNSYAPLVMDIVLPPECGHDYSCSISVGFQHSWNTNNTGHLNCQLYSPESRVISEMLINTTLDEDGSQMRHTGTVRTKLSVPHVAGKFSLHCMKLDNRRTCITTLTAQTLIEV